MGMSLSLVFECSCLHCQHDDGVSGVMKFGSELKVSFCQASAGSSYQDSDQLLCLSAVCSGEP